MAVRFDIKTVMMIGLLWGACAEEGEPQGPRDVNDEDIDEAEADDDDEDDDATGSKKDAGKDSGKKDAGSSDDDDDTSGDDDSASEDDDSGDDDAAGGACDELTYKSFGKSFAEKYCAKCHEGDEPSSSIQIDSLETFDSFKADVITRVVDKKTMPPKAEKAQPTADERAKLKEWLDCGPE